MLAALPPGMSGDSQAAFADTEPVLGPKCLLRAGYVPTTAGSLPDMPQMTFASEGSMLDMPQTTFASLPPMAMTMDLPEVDEDEQDVDEQGEEEEEIGAEDAIRPVVDEADQEGFVAPWIRMEKHDSANVARPCLANRYHVGKRLRFYSATAGGMVDAVVTDCRSHCSGGVIRVAYFRGFRCFSKVLATTELEDDAAAAESPCEVGTPVMVRSRFTNVWFQGTVLCSDDDGVKVHYWHNGHSLVRRLAPTSADLQLCRGPSYEAAPRARVMDPSTRELRVLELGMLVSLPARNGVEATGVVADIQGLQAKIHINSGRKSFFRVVPTVSLVLAPAEPLVDTPSLDRLI